MLVVVGVTFSQLSVDSDYDRFVDFNCDYKDNISPYPYPEYARLHIKSLSDYLCHENGARADLQRGYGVTTVAYVDGHVAGYYTLMAGSIYEPRFPDNSRPEEFPFPCKTYPAIKITRFAVSNKYQGIPIAVYAYGDKEYKLHIKDFMFNQIHLTGTRLSYVERERDYTLSEMIPDLIGVRYIIADALAVPRTLRFYRKVGFEAFMPGDYRKRLEEILEEKLG